MALLLALLLLSLEAFMITYGWYAIGPIILAVYLAKILTAQLLMAENRKRRLAKAESNA